LPANRTQTLPQLPSRVPALLTCTRWRVEAESDADLQSRQPLEHSSPRTDRDQRECNRRALTAHVRCHHERPAALPAG
jgi:hypothetical protein